MNTFFRKWIFAALINLVLVSMAGVLLRYKILFHLPVVHHKNLLHAHSHFAFSGWLSLALCASILYILHQYKPIDEVKYQRLFWFSQISSFGMLFTFPFMGYAAPSITFSTLYIFYSYIFTAVIWKDLEAIPKEIRQWISASLVFWVISSLGAFALAFLMATGMGTQQVNIGSVYFFLHFQYNGWFLFAIGALLLFSLRETINIQDKNLQKVYKYLAVAVIPGYILSALWMDLPIYLYIPGVVAALLQLAGMFYLWKFLLKNAQVLKRAIAPLTRKLWILALVAVSLKFVFQAVSTVPSLSQFAFGHRPIVIGFLHLVLLGFATLFLWGYFFREGHFKSSTSARNAVWIFVSGVMLNEGVLFLQGLAAMNYAAVPYTNQYLLVAAIILFLGLLLLSIAQKDHYKRAQTI